MAAARPAAPAGPVPPRASAGRCPRQSPPPAAFRWRRRAFDLARAEGPERIAPEWWLDDPDWRSGPRDYWRVQTGQGDRLWLFYAHGGAVSGGWFCQGLFA